jgi:hypothetical protein
MKRYKLIGLTLLFNKPSKKQIITVFEPIYLDVLNDDMVGCANITARSMLDHLFITYVNITAVDLENNFEHMRRAWDPQQPVDTLFKQIQNCADYSEAGGVLIGHPQQINLGYAKIFATGHFISACRRWNEKPHAEKNWAQFNAHFSAAHRQHKQMHGESAATSCYHSANAAVGKTENQMTEATIGALSKLSKATASDRGVVATLTEDRLFPQAEITLNLLRTSRQHPQLSAAAHYRGLIDYNKTAFAPPGCKIIAHEKPANRRTWSPHGQHGYSFGPAMYHYRCQNVYISATASERIVDTLEFFPSQFTNATIVLHRQIDRGRQQHHQRIEKNLTLQFHLHKSGMTK